MEFSNGFNEAILFVWRIVGAWGWQMWVMTFVVIFIVWHHLDQTVAHYVRRLRRKGVRRVR